MRAGTCDAFRRRANPAPPTGPHLRPGARYPGRGARPPLGRVEWRPAGRAKRLQFIQPEPRGGMRERSKRAVLKTAVRETAPGVRIPLPPPALKPWCLAEGGPPAHSRDRTRSSRQARPAGGAAAGSGAPWGRGRAWRIRAQPPGRSHVDASAGAASPRVLPGPEPDRGGAAGPRGCAAPRRLPPADQLKQNRARGGDEADGPGPPSPFTRGGPTRRVPGAKPRRCSIS